MILTCPRCATRYFVDPAQIGRGGRTVRCADCQQSWIARPAAERATAEAADLAPTNRKAASPLFAAAPAKPMPRPWLKFTRSPWRVGVALAVILLILLAFVFRTQIVQLWLA